MQKSHLGGDEDLPEWPEELKQETLLFDLTAGKGISQIHLG